ncbi:MAG: DUF86 domain-containing protein [Desulfobacterales bacterium]|jgi:uncharacterized protein with HEPN domain|nr:DUF86 domain-containing protein [Desulfobacterales bacterium]
MRRDDILLLDMLIAARDAVEFLRTSSREEFEQNRMQLWAVTKAIEIVGEAASRVSQPFRMDHPEIPWEKIIGMRHRLVHGYFEIDRERVWKTTKAHLPSLIATLEKLVPPEED